MDDAALTFVARLRDEASSAARALRGNLRAISGRVGDVLVPVRARDEASGVLRAISGTADRAGAGVIRGAAAVATGIGRTGVVIGGALGLAAGAAVSLGVKTAASMQTAKIGFTTMLGGARQADSFLRQLSSFAATTPFEFPELQTAASSLISAGIEASKVIPIMTTLGDVTSGMGTGAEGVQRATVALQQMNAAGKITGEDLNQLRDAGIPVFDLLAAATGKSKKEVAALAQAGKLGGKELGQLMNALETGKGLERFSGLMKEQSKSLTGVWSTLKDTVSMGLSTALQPAIPMLTDLATKANTLATSALPGFTSKVQAAVGAIPQLVTNGRGMVAVLRQFGPGSDEAAGALSRLTGIPPGAITAVQSAISDLGTVIRDVVIPALTTAGSSALPGFLTPLGLLREVLGLAADHTDTARVALVALIAILTAAKVGTAAYSAVQLVQNGLANVAAARERAKTAATAAGAAATRVAAAATGLSSSTLATWIGVKALELGAWVRSTAATVASTVANGANRLAYGTAYLVTFIATKALEFAAWVRSTAAVVASTAANLAANAAAMIVRGGIIAATAAQWALNAAMSANPIGLVIAALVALGIGLVLLWQKSSTFRAIVLAVWAAVRTAIGASVAWIRAQLSRLGAVISTVWRAIATAVSVYVRTYVAVIRAAFNAARAVVSAVMGAIGAVVRTVVAAVKAYIAGWAAIAGWVRSAFERARAAASEKLSALVGLVRGIPGKIKSAIGNAGSVLLGVGGDIIGGLVNGIRNGISRVEGAVRDLASKIPAPIRKLLGIRSPSRVMMTIGRQIMSGLEIGITKGRAGVQKATDAAAALVVRAFGEKSKALKDAKAGAAALRAAARARDGAVALLDRGEVRLAKIAAKRQATTAKLTAATKRLADLTKARDDLIAQTRDSALAFADVTKASDTSEGAPVTAETIGAGLDAALGKLRAFQAAIADLKRRGLNATSLSQIIAAGVDQGGDTAAALSSASTSQLRQINATQAAIGKVATTLGSTAGSSLYGAGIQAARGLVAGLKSQTAALDAAGERIARSLVSAVKRALGIRSPSRVFRAEVGQQLAAGAALGIVDGTATAVRAAQSMASQITAAATPDLVALDQLARVQSLGALTSVQRIEGEVTVRHVVDFAQPEVAARMSAREVAELLNADPRAMRAVEAGLSGVRGQAATSRVTAPSSRRSS